MDEERMIEKRSFLLNISNLLFDYLKYHIVILSNRYELQFDSRDNKRKVINNLIFFCINFQISLISIPKILSSKNNLYITTLLKLY